MYDSATVARIQVILQKKDTIMMRAFTFIKTITVLIRKDYIYKLLFLRLQILLRWNWNVCSLISVSETEIELRLCNITCDEKTCIPKCCGPDEILTYWTFVCRKINEREKKWRPKIYHSDYPHHEVSNANDDKKVQFHRKRLHCDEFHRWPLSNTIGAKKRNVSDPRTP